MKKTFLLIPILLMLFALNSFATVTIETNRVQYNCNGTTTAYAYPFEILEDDDLLVITANSAGSEATLTLNTDYTVAGEGTSTGGTMTLTAGSKCPSGSTLTMLRNIELQQQTDYVDGTSFSAESLEGALDKNMLIIQQMNEKLSRTPALNKTSALTDLIIDAPVAGEYLRWNLTGDGIDSTASSNDLGTFTQSGTGGVERTADSKIGEIVSVTDFGAKCDGSTDDTTAFQSALNTGKTVYVPYTSTHCHITDALTMSVAGTKLISDSNTTIEQQTEGKAGINITASNVTVRGIKLTGTQYTVSTEAEKAIYAYGADASHYITDIHIEDCEFSTWGYAGVWLSFVSDFTVSRNKFTNVYYAGIATLSSIRGSISENNINNIVGNPNAYGIAMSRTANDSLVTCPRSGYITVSDNIIRNVPYWEGIDTHGGEYITISNNIIKNTYIGITVTTSNNGSAVETFAPVQVVVDNNVMDSGVTDGTALYGIDFVGVEGGALATGTISNNTIIGYGKESIATSGGMYIRATEGLPITGNTLIDLGTVGIYLYNHNIGTIVSNNSITDPWSDTVAVGSIMAIRIGGDATQVSTPLVKNNYFYRGDKTATYTLDTATGYGVYIDNTANLAPVIGINYCNGVVNALSDVGYKAAKLSLDSVSTSGTGEDTLGTMTIPAATMGIGGGLKIIAAGTKTGANDTKALKFYFGATAVTFHAAANNTNDWRFEATIFNTATNAQVITWIGHDGATPLQGYDTTAIDTTAAVTVKITGECANAADAVLQKMFFIDRI
jgi:parallel beta-helix repeat protein